MFESLSDKLGKALRNLRGVGDCVQGFALGYVLASWATDILIGGVTQNVDTQWMLMGISALSGGGAAKTDG